MKRLILKPEHRYSMINKPNCGEVLHMAFVDESMYQYLYNNGHQNLFEVLDDNKDDLDIPIYKPVIDEPEDLPLLDYVNKKK